MAEPDGGTQSQPGAKGEVRVVEPDRLQRTIARRSAEARATIPHLELSAEVAARRATFDNLPFATGYAIETSMLLHARDLVGIGHMAQVDLDVRRNYHQPLTQLGPMSYAVLRVILERLRRDHRLKDDHAPPLQTAAGRLIQVELIERPPYASIRLPA